MKSPTPLTARFVETVIEPGRYGDGRGGFGLILQVHRGTDGRISKSWLQRIRIDRKPTHIGIGVYPVVTLAEARRAALANARTVAKGDDPRAGGIPTFRMALDRVIDVMRPGWRNPKSEAQWRASLRDHAAPLMEMAVDAIGPGDVLAVLVPVWTAKRATATRVRQRISAVMKLAIAEGWRESNPVDAIAAALPQNGHRRKHHRALPYAAVGGALATVRASGAWAGTKAAFEFLVLTAARSGEVRGMRWSEVDRDTATWTVPADRMKAARDHRVPLSGAALAVLDAARALSGGEPDDLVFPSVRGRALSDATIGKLLSEHGIDAVPHGFRSSFRDWANERTSTPHAVMEAALAHVVRDKAEAAYSRSDHLDKRRILMDAWADYLAVAIG